MEDWIPTKKMTVEVQENGIIRNDKGRIIARFVDDIDFDSEHIYESLKEKSTTEQKYKVLSYSGMMVDQLLLRKGIYGTPTPKLHPPETTLESLIQEYKKFPDTVGHGIVDESIIENLSKCELVEVTLDTH
jgi:hypothetical protein